MGKFRKKPVVIEAWQWNDGDEGARQLVEIGGGAISYESTISGPPHPETREDWGLLRVETLEGEHEATPLDWLIRGVKGEFYFCKPDIFDATYEAVE